jgi:hypothetical protein
MTKVINQGDMEQAPAARGLAARAAGKEFRGRAHYDLENHFQLDYARIA